MCEGQVGQAGPGDMKKEPRELIDFLHRYDPGVQDTALGLRLVVLEEMAPCHEYIFAMRHTVVLLYGPTPRVIEDCVCMISVHRKHANLRFTDGASLDDSYRVLEGTGKRMRHLKVKALSDLGRPEIRAYLRQARKSAGMTRPRRRTADDVITEVKTTPSRKGRPARQTPRALR
jgi:hypothetical protein